MRIFHVSPTGEGGTMLNGISCESTAALWTKSGNITEQTRCGQAEYYYAVSREILETADQRQKEPFKAQL